jgi:hypothetical protein
MSELIDELDLLFKARYPVVWMQTSEEVRALVMINELAAKRSTAIMKWSLTTGLMDGTTSIANTQPLDGALAHVSNIVDKTMRFVILIDPHPHMTDNVVIRHFKDLCIKLPMKTRTTIFVISPSDRIPPDLQKLITMVDLPLPDKVILGDIVDKIVSKWEDRAKSDAGTKLLIDAIREPVRLNKDQIVTAGLGLVTDEFTNITTKMMLSKTIDPALILGEKKQIIRKGGMLEYIDERVTTEMVGGLDAFKTWLTYATKTLGPSAEAYGLKPLRGVMLVGPPGTGKTLLAKLIATVFGVPLVLLDMANVTTKFYGESTSNTKRALNIADALAPDVFLWDEVEKMFATGGAGEGHEETMRTLSVLLTHLEESKAPVFRVATCNNPLNLKPEMLQRFPKIFFVDLPNPLERRSIFEIQLKDFKQEPKRFDITRLSSSTDGYVGREIRNVIHDAMIHSFYEDRPLETEDIIEVVNLTTPLAKQDKIRVEIDAVREWAGMNACYATTPSPPNVSQAEDSRDVIP